MWQRKKGFTLIELIVVLVVLAVLVAAVVPSWSRLMERERATVGINGMRGLLFSARAAALNHREHVVVCADDCKRFDDARRVRVFMDPNRNRRLDEQERLVAQETIGDDRHLSWHPGARGEPWLEYQPSGLLDYQNGHFLFCAGRQGYKLVINWVGRPYIKPAGSADCPP